MLSFDARTVVLVAFMTNTLVFFSLLALSQNLPRMLLGLREGVYAAFGWSAGAGLILARGAIPDFLSLWLGNLVYTGGIWALYLAVRLATRASLGDTGWVWAMAVGGFIAFTHLWMDGSYAEFLPFITAYNAVVFLACATAAWRAKPLGFSVGITGMALTLAALVSAMRCLSLKMGVGVVPQAIDPSVLQSWYFSLMALTSILALLGFTFITYERLNKLLVTTNSTLEFEVAARTADLSQEVEQRQVLERLVATTAEAERRRIGSELHDDLGQRLTGISLIAEVLSGELNKASQHLSMHAEAIQQAASDAIVQVRRLAHGLIPVAPEPEGFGDALAQLAKTSSTQGFHCKFEYDEPTHIKDPDVASNLFRIAQEAVSNAMRHAKACNITIRLDEVEGKVVLSVADDGRGFVWPQPQTENSRGMGIMEFRASLIHYRLDVISTLGCGTLIKASEC